jgi:hypothetical protein
LGVTMHKFNKGDVVIYTSRSWTVREQPTFSTDGMYLLNRVASDGSMVVAYAHDDEVTAADWDDTLVLDLSEFSEGDTEPGTDWHDGLYGNDPGVK